MISYRHQKTTVNSKPNDLEKQTDANRRNALLSTGPQTEEGKRATRKNALRHGLTAETVIGTEDPAEYAAFEAEVLADYEPQSTVERELTLRLASLLWRLRRASVIETGLLQAQCESSSDGNGAKPSRKPSTQVIDIAVRLQKARRNYAHCEDRERTTEDGALAVSVQASVHKTCVVTRAFLQLADMPSMPFERIGRYEAALWRQFVQVLFAIDEAKRHRLVSSRRRFTPYPSQW